MNHPLYKMERSDKKMERITIKIPVGKNQKFQKKKNEKKNDLKKCKKLKQGSKMAKTLDNGKLAKI